MHGAIVFVGPACEGEEALDAGLDFGGAVFAGLRLDAGGEFVGAVLEVFGEELEELGAGVGGPLAAGRGP